MSVGAADFAAAILDADAPVPEGLSGPEGRRAGRRFDVYRNNVVAGLIDALATGFPAVRKLLGETNFRVMAGAFVRQHPPRSPVMMTYGGDLPAFLEDFEPAQGLGYLPDVARLELALREAYHATDASPIDPARLAALDPEALMAARIRLIPAVRVVRSHWPVLSIWRYTMEPGQPKPAARAEDVIVLRESYDASAQLLPTGGAAFLSGLLDGARLGEAVARAEAETDALDLAGILGILLEKQVIAEVLP